MLTFRSIIASLFALALLSGCSDVSGVVENPDDVLKPPAGFPAIAVPADNPYSAAKAELGRRLFYDTRLSRDYSVSCGSCHRQEHAFTDASALSSGFEGRIGSRNAMTLTNVAYNTSFFWDGGVPTLEQQAIAPIIHPDEMNMHTDTLVTRLRSAPVYAELFAKAWGTSDISLERITRSIATFERRLLSSESGYDKWKRGDWDAMSGAAVRGSELFFGEKGDCFHCHGSFNFSDNMFHNNAIDSISTGDEGRFKLTQRSSDMGSFRTPTLRNVALTGPYMHDGRFATLEEVVRHYNSGGKPHPSRDALMRPLGLTPREEEDLVEFLKALTDPAFLSDTSLSDPW